MPLKNPFINYIDRSYEQIKSSILSKFSTEVPELTDHTENNFFVRLVSVWAGIAEMLGYYINSVAREFYLSTAKRYSSAIKIANMFNYRVRGIRSSIVKVKFSLDSSISSNITIPKYTKVSSETGIEFLTTKPSILQSGQTFVEVTAKQGMLVESREIGISNGAENQRFELPEDIEDESIIVIINGVTWNFIQNLALANINDLVFTTILGRDKKMVLIFGDNITGAIPQNGASIKVTYLTSEGVLGNIPKNSITEVKSSISVPNDRTLSVTNEKNAVGGLNIESLEDLKKSIPLSIRTLNRGVTIQDLKDLTLLYGGIDSAVIRKVSGGIDVHISLIGGGTPTDELKTKIKNYLDKKKQQLVLIDINVKGVSIIKPKLTFSVNINSSYDELRVINNLKQALKNYVNNIDISKPLIVGNIYQIIEATDGVNYSDNLTIDYDLLLEGNDKVLDIRSFKNKAVNNPIVNKYDIEIKSNLLYTIYKNGASLKEGRFGSNVDTDDFTININSDVNYVVGEKWYFYVYNKNKSIYPKSVSSFVLSSSNLVLNVI